MEGKLKLIYILLITLAVIFLTGCEVDPSITEQALNSTHSPSRTIETSSISPTPTLTPIINPTPAIKPVNILLSDKLTLHNSGYLLSYLVSLEEYEAYRDLFISDPSLKAVQAVYSYLKDDFDFVFVINNEEKDVDVMGNGITFALRTYPETGLGSLNSFEDGLPYVKISSPLENETERLMTMIHFANKDAVRKGPVLHEMMHRWGNFVLPGPREFAMHWGFSNVGGQLGGFTDLEPFKEGTFHAFNRFRPDKCFSPNTPSATWDTRNTIPYAPLELYLMGLLRIDEIPSEIIVLEDGWFVDDAACIVSGVKHVYQTEDLLQPIRQPEPAFSQKRFKILTVVVTPTPLPEEEWDYYLQQLKWFEYEGDDGDPDLYNFWEATGGRASVEFGKITESLNSNE
jgi:hypothetical protein